MGRKTFQLRFSYSYTKNDQQVHSIYHILENEYKIVVKKCYYCKVRIQYFLSTRMPIINLIFFFSQINKIHLILCCTCTVHISIKIQTKCLLWMQFLLFSIKKMVQHNKLAEHYHIFGQEFKFLLFCRQCFLIETYD